MVGVEIGISAVSVLKDVINYLKSRKDKDPELMALFDKLKAEVYELKLTNIELLHQIDTLIEKIKLQESFQFDYQTETYWIISDEAKDGPFCQRCHDDQAKQIRLRTYDDTRWVCPKCNAHYFKPGGEELFEQRREKALREQKQRNQRRVNPWL